MYEGQNIHYEKVEGEGGEEEKGGKLLCSFSGKICRLRRLHGYGFCVRHILEDEAAPFKRCDFKVKTGQQCSNAIPKREHRQYCQSHMISLGLVPKKEKKPKKSTAATTTLTPECVTTVNPSDLIQPKGGQLSSNVRPQQLQEQLAQSHHHAQQQLTINGLPRSMSLINASAASALASVAAASMTTASNKDGNGNRDELEDLPFLKGVAQLSASAAIAAAASSSSFNDNNVGIRSGTQRQPFRERAVSASKLYPELAGKLAVAARRASLGGGSALSASGAVPKVSSSSSASNSILASSAHGKSSLAPQLSSSARPASAGRGRGRWNASVRFNQAAPLSSSAAHSYGISTTINSLNMSDGCLAASSGLPLGSSLSASVPLLGGGVLLKDTWLAPTSEESGPVSRKKSRLEQVAGGLHEVSTASGLGSPSGLVNARVGLLGVSVGDFQGNNGVSQSVLGGKKPSHAVGGVSQPIHVFTALRKTLPVRRILKGAAGRYGKGGMGEGIGGGNKGSGRASDRTGSLMDTWYPQRCIAPLPSALLRTSSLAASTSRALMMASPTKPHSLSSSLNAGCLTSPSGRQTPLPILSRSRRKAANKRLALIQRKKERDVGLLARIDSVSMFRDPATFALYRQYAERKSIDMPLVTRVVDTDSDQCGSDYEGGSVEASTSSVHHRSATSTASARARHGGPVKSTSGLHISPTNRTYSITDRLEGVPTVCVKQESAEKQPGPRRVVKPWRQRDGCASAHKRVRRSACPESLVCYSRPPLPTESSDEEEERDEGSGVCESLRLREVERTHRKVTRMSSSIRTTRESRKDVKEWARGLAAAARHSRLSTGRVLREIHTVDPLRFHPSPVAGSKRCLYVAEEDGPRCNRFALPLTNHCLKHILHNPFQSLFVPCAVASSLDDSNLLDSSPRLADSVGEDCPTPVLAISSVSVCRTHAAPRAAPALSATTEHKEQTTPVRPSTRRQHQLGSSAAVVSARKADGRSSPQPSSQSISSPPLTFSIHSSPSKRKKQSPSGSTLPVADVSTTDRRPSDTAGSGGGLSTDSGTETSPDLLGLMGLISGNTDLLGVAGSVGGTSGGGDPLSAILDEQEMRSVLGFFDDEGLEGDEANMSDVETDLANLLTGGDSNIGVRELHGDEPVHNKMATSLATTMTLGGSVGGERFELPSEISETILDSEEQLELKRRRVVGNLPGIATLSSSSQSSVQQQQHEADLQRTLSETDFDAISHALERVGQPLGHAEAVETHHGLGGHLPPTGGLIQQQGIPHGVVIQHQQYGSVSGVTGQGEVYIGSMKGGSIVNGSAPVEYLMQQHHYTKSPNGHMMIETGPAVLHSNMPLPPTSSFLRPVPTSQPSAGGNGTPTLMHTGSNGPLPPMPWVRRPSAQQPPPPSPAGYHPHHSHPGAVAVNNGYPSPLASPVPGPVGFHGPPPMYGQQAQVVHTVAVGGPGTVTMGTGTPPLVQGLQYYTQQQLSYPPHMQVPH